MSTARPVFLLAGGRSSRQGKKDTILPALFKEIGRAAPAIAYVGAASEDDRSFFKFMAAEFLKGGAGEVVHALTVSGKADLGRARDVLEKADAVFISGGDVERGMEILEEQKLIGFLQGLYSGGKVFFGSSAGSIMLAREWVRWSDPEDDSSAELFPCLGFAPVICDTHAESDDWEELRTALSLKPADSTGYGIPTGSCLKVNSENDFEALGGPISKYAKENQKVVKKPDITPA